VLDLDGDNVKKTQGVRSALPLFDGTFFAFILPMLARDTGFNNILK